MNRIIAAAAPLALLGAAAPAHAANYGMFQVFVVFEADPTRVASAAFAPLVADFTANRAGALATLDTAGAYVTENLKTRIQDLTGASPTDERILFGGVELIDGFMLADYGIDSEDFLVASIATGIPEVSPWVMMIAGFGAIGMAMRIRSFTIRYA